MLKRFFSDRFAGIYIFFIVFISIATLIRTILFFRAFDFVDFGIAEIAKIYLTGLLYDFVTATYFMVPFVIYMTLIPNFIYRHKLHKFLSYIIFFSVIFSLFFNLVSELLFWNEFGVRFNFIAVDYLVYTHEVIGNIRESYPLTSLLIGIFVASSIIFYYILKNDTFKLSFESEGHYKKRFLKGFVLLTLPFIFFMTIDDSLSKVSLNKYNNELSKNGIYSLFVAFRKNKLDYNRFYIKKDEKVVFNRLKQNLDTNKSKFLSSNLFDITREISNDDNAKKYNIMLIMVESLSAKFLTRFGEKLNLTPNLDKIIKDSMLFTNFFATGTRTVRGMEAVSLSIPPTAGRSIVKRLHNENMFSTGFVFRANGYDTKFIYGGHGYFDNMNYFFENNGFKTIDRLSMDEVEFENIWGACDEDLFKATLKEADKSYTQNKPFFNFIMTTSNHRPYSYPDGRIDIASKTGRRGAIKYTDYAINKFLEMSKTKPWFKDTLFVIMADHCAGSAGKVDLPIEKYHIPLIIYNPNIIKPREVNTLCSQIDVVPTLLSMLNISYKSKFFGKDIFNMQKSDERALIGTYQKLGLMKDNILTILSAGKKVEFYGYDLKEKENLSQLKDDSEKLLDTLSYYQGADYIYNHKLNRNIDEYK